MTAFTPDIVLIDLGSAYWAAWHSTANEAVSFAHDRCVNAVRQLRHLAPHVAVCCDSPRSWRRDKHPAYKAQRPEKDRSAIEQLLRTKATLEADGFLLWEADGFEADDVIATGVRAARERGYTVLIASSDKDLLSLVTEEVRVLSLKTSTHYDPAAVFEKLGVPPEKVRDWLVLVGDTSDNVAGVPGVGAKRAAELLMRFGDLDELLHAVKLGTKEGGPVSTPKIVESLTASLEIMQVGVELVTLRSDVPINFDAIFEAREVRPLAKDDEWGDLKGDEPETQAAAAAPPKSEPRASADPPSNPANAPSSPEFTAPSTKIVKVDTSQQWALALEPSDTREAWRMAKVLHDSRLYSAFGSAEAVFAVILRGRSLGMDATTALANFHVVEGKPTMSATLIVGLVIQSGKAEYFEIVESTNDKATWATKRKSGRREVVMSFDLNDALAAGVLERHNGALRGVSKSGKPSNWDKWRRTMLRHRAATELARAVYPDITAGLYTSDEISGGTVIDAEFEAA